MISELIGMGFYPRCDGSFRHIKYKLTVDIGAFRDGVDGNYYVCERLNHASIRTINRLLDSFQDDPV